MSPPRPLSMQLDVTRRELVFGDAKIGRHLTRLHAARDHVRMLEQQQRIRDHAGPPLLDELLLQLRRLAVRHAPQPPHFQNRVVDGSGGGG